MLDPVPVWKFDSKKPLTQWYNHVHLLAEHVVGQWFCVERESGKLLWQTQYFRPNTICGIDSGVIVASEMRSDGSWTYDFGCYGISLASGKLRWTAHQTGIWGVLLRGLDFVPCFTNELRDHPRYVEHGQVFCNSGRVLDVQTGTLQKRVPRETFLEHRPQPKTHPLHRGLHANQDTGVKVAEDTYLHLERGPGELNRSLKVTAKSKSGSLLWTFSTEPLQRKLESYQLVPPFLVLTVSDESKYKPHPTREHYLLPNPTIWHLVIVELANGQIVQDFLISPKKQTACQVEDCDSHGLLVSLSKKELLYFRRSTVGNTT